MDFYVLTLRIIHILGGAFWAGSAFLLTGWIAPTAGQLRPEGPRFMQRLILGTRSTMAISLAAGLAIVSGLLLYWRASGGLQTDWMSTGAGVMFTIGGLAAIAAGVLGGLIAGNGKKLAELGSSLQGPPSPEQAVELGHLQSRGANLGAANAVLLVITIIAMASAQYVFF